MKICGNIARACSASLFKRKTPMLPNAVISLLNSALQFLQ